MNKKMWENFYLSEHDQYPTSFAKFAIDFIPACSEVIDLGCGNGRDSYYLGEKGNQVKGFDYAFQPKDFNGALFSTANLTSIFKEKCSYDVVYSRFFLHSITANEVRQLLAWSKGLFLAEFRCVGDNPVIYKDHKRTIIYPEFIFETMIDMEYEILYFHKSRGLAVYKEEDPLVGRIVARR